jgi:hypothetical protein
LAIVKGSVSQYGTIQRILRDEKITTTSAAKIEAQRTLRDPMRVYEFSTIDVNTIPAGDKIIPNDSNYIVLSCTHNCGTPGRMSISAANMDYVRLEYFMN